MESMHERTKWLIGDENLIKLKSSKIILFGVGGVGGYCAEALGRAGVGNITLVDFDKVDITNINRQIIATNTTIGKEKAIVMKNRLEDINKDINAVSIINKVSKENINEYNIEGYDYVIDAIDDVKAKIALIVKSIDANIPIISSMGTGNKIHGEKFLVADISKTHTCPLAKVIRKELGKIGIKHLKVVFSTEEPKRKEEATKNTKSPASISFIPPIAGLLLAGEVIRDIINKQ